MGALGGHRAQATAPLSGGVAPLAGTGGSGVTQRLGAGAREIAQLSGAASGQKLEIARVGAGQISEIVRLRREELTRRQGARHGALAKSAPPTLAAGLGPTAQPGTVGDARP